MIEGKQSNDQNISYNANLNTEEDNNEETDWDEKYRKIKDKS